MLNFCYWASACLTLIDKKASIFHPKQRNVRCGSLHLQLYKFQWFLAEQICGYYLRTFVYIYEIISLVFRAVSFSTTQDISSVCNELETVKCGMNLETFWFRMFTVKPRVRKHFN